MTCYHKNCKKWLVWLEGALCVSLLVEREEKSEEAKEAIFWIVDYDRWCELRGRGRRCIITWSWRKSNIGTTNGKGIFLKENDPSWRWFNGNR